MPASLLSKPSSARRTPAARRGALLAAAVWTGLSLAGAARAAEPAASAPAREDGAASTRAWPVAGQQGLVRIVIVPPGTPPDRALYAGQIKQLCPPDRSCFLNFYANPQGVPVTVPLPDAVSEAATAVFRRSLKQGAELFQWSCRLKQADGECF